jgi:hypothetical protein
MKAIRVSRLKNDVLAGMNPNTKIWYSLEEPVAVLSKISTAELEQELSRRQRQLAEELFQICAIEVMELGFSMKDFL